MSSNVVQDTSAVILGNNNPTTTVPKRTIFYTAWVMTVFALVGLCQMVINFATELSENERVIELFQKYCMAVATAGVTQTDPLRSTSNSLCVANRTLIQPEEA